MISKEKNIKELLNLGINFEKEKNIIKAIEVYREILKIDKNLINLHLKLGSLFYSINKFKESLIYFRNVLILDNKNAMAYFFIGECFNNLNKLNESFFAYKKSFELNKSIEAGFGLSSIGMKKNKFNESLEILKELKKEKSDIKILTNMGYCYKNLNETKKAKDILEESLNIAENEITLNLLAEISNEENKYDKEIEYYKKSLKIKNDFNIKNKLIKALFEIGKIKEGFKEFLPNIFIKNETEESHKIYNKFIENLKTIDYKKENKYLILSNSSLEQNIYFIKFLNKEFKNLVKGKITLVCNEDLKLILEKKKKNIILDEIKTEAKIEEYDYLINLESIPYYLNTNKLDKDSYLDFKSKKNKKMKIGITNLSEKIKNGILNVEYILLNGSIKDILEKIKEVDLIITENMVIANLSGALGIKTINLNKKHWMINKEENSKFYKNQYNIKEQDEDKLIEKLKKLIK